MRFSLTLGVLATLALPACSSASKPEIGESQYWQRVSASSAAYIRGPKAQQILNRDIARCVVELRELERLGSITSAIPTDSHGRILDPAHDLSADDWDTPERDGALLAEHGDYHDFDSCMLTGGWERIKYVPFDVAEKAQLNYLSHHVATRDHYTESGRMMDVSETKTQSAREADDFNQ